MSVVPGDGIEENTSRSVTFRCEKQAGELDDELLFRLMLVLSENNNLHFNGKFPRIMSFKLIDTWQASQINPGGRYMALV